MAKPYRSKPASYYFREIHPGEWEITKFDGSGGGDDTTPSVVYKIKGDPNIKGRWACDCPATWGGKNRAVQECKHGPMLQRWISIQTRGLNKGMVVYYSSEHDRFYPLPGLQIEDPNKPIEP